MRIRLLFAARPPELQNNEGRRIADACYVPYVAPAKGERMKKAVTFRFDAALLEEARRCAVSENRTLTNFIETLVKTHMASRAAAAAPQDAVVILPPQTRPA